MPGDATAGVVITIGSDTTPAPALTATGEAVMVSAYVIPPYVIEPDSAFVFAVPVFVTETLHPPAGGDAPVQAAKTWTEDAETCAEDVNDPKRPKTNPAMAIAAMSVIAMRMTVAMTGDIAFLS